MALSPLPAPPIPNVVNDPMLDDWWSQIKRHADEQDRVVNMFRTLEDFGAKGDGSTDDSAALQSALRFCSTWGVDLVLQNKAYRYNTSPSWGGGTTTFTANRTINSATLTGISSTSGFLVGQQISGTGIPNFTRIAAIPSSTTLVMSKKASSTGSSFTVTRVLTSPFTIRGIGSTPFLSTATSRLLHGGTADTYYFTISNCRGVNVENVLLSRLGASTATRGMLLEGCQQCTFRNVHVQSASDRAWTLDTTTTGSCILNTFICCSGVGTDGNPASGDVDFGVYLDATDVGFSVNDNTWLNCVFTNCDTDVFIADATCNENTFIACDLKTKVTNGICVDTAGRNTTIIACNLEGGDVAYNTTGILVQNVTDSNCRGIANNVGNTATPLTDAGNRFTGDFYDPTAGVQESFEYLNRIARSFGPRTDNAADLGSATKEWKDIYYQGQIKSTATTGTAPLTVASTTKVANLNADLLDDQTGTYYLDSANFTGTNWTDLTDGGTTTLHTHTSGVASSITVANEATDTTCFPVFVTAATGDLAPKSNANLAFDASTGTLTLTGNITYSGVGNVAQILANTSDGADSKAIYISGAGAAADPDRGAWIALNGNETGGGAFTLRSGTGGGAGFTAGTGVVEVIGGFRPSTDDGTALGQTTHNFSDLFLASGALLNFANGNAVVTHSSGILTVSTGDLRVTTAGTNAASAVTVGGTQTLTSKTLTSPVIGTSPTAAGATWTDLGTVTTADINGGTVDGATIGGTTPGAITGTSLSNTGTTFTLQTAQYTAFRFQFINTAGTLQHRFISLAGAAVLSDYTTTINNGTATLTNSPTGADASTAMANGGKISTVNTNSFILDTDDQVDDESAAYSAFISYNDTSVDFRVRGVVVSSDVNGVTQRRLQFRFFNGTTGASLALDTTNVPSGKQFTIDFQGFLK